MSRFGRYALAISFPGILLRFYEISGEIWGKHGWRQADVSMIARNFHHHGYNIAFPQIDWAGPNPGYVGTEFPLVPYLMSLCYALAGPSVVWGRLISIAFFATSLAPFYLLVKKYGGERLACWALFFYTFSPLSIYYTRVPMSDGAVLSLSVLAVYLLDLWCENRETSTYVATTIVATLAVLVKVPAAVIALPMGYLGTARDGRKFWQQKTTYLMIAVVAGSSAAWYSHASHLASHYSPFEMFGEGFWGLKSSLESLRIPFFHKRLLLQSVALIVSPMGALLALWGFAKRADFLGSRLFQWWGLGFLLTLLAGFAGQSIHEYYQLQALPFVAVYAACGALLFLRRLPRYAPLLVLLVLIPSLFLTATRFHGVRGEELYLAGSIAREAIPEDALVIAWDFGNPLLLYAANRKGWGFPRRPRTKRGDDIGIAPEQYAEVVEELRALGATHFMAPRPVASRDGPFRVLTRALLGPAENNALNPESPLARWLDATYIKVLDRPEVVVYSLSAEPVKGS